LNAATKAISEQFAAKRAEAEAAAADPEKAAPIIAEAQALKARLETAQKAETDLAALKAWDNDPATALPQPGVAISGEGSFAGKTAIDLLTGEVYEEGKGVLSNRQVKAIADTNYLKYFPDLLRAGGQIGRVQDKEARKFLSEGIDQDGGVLVPAQIIAGMLRREAALVRVLDMVQTVNISADRAAIVRSRYNTDDQYSSAVRIYKTGEGAAATKSAQPQFGTFNVDAHQYTAELSLSYQLWQDTNYDLNGYLAQEFRTATRNFGADKVLNGSGVGDISAF